MSLRGSRIHEAPVNVSFWASRELSGHVQAMSKFVLILGALLLCSSLPAQIISSPGEQAPSSWTLTNTAVTQYMLRGTRLGGLSFQPSLAYATGGFGLGVWANVP